MGDLHRLKSRGRGDAMSAVALTLEIPAFAGTTASLGYPLAAVTLENRFRIRSSSPSQTSR